MRVRSDAGQVLPLVALALVVAVAAVVVAGLVGQAVVFRARAQTAADAAALAGAAEGEPAARELAAANGARLVQFEVEGTDTQVEVRVGDIGARARARRT
jgi:hypothetical protein